MESGRGDKVEKDNSTPLRKSELKNPAIVQAVEACLNLFASLSLLIKLTLYFAQAQSHDDSSSSHPQSDPKDSAEEVKRANQGAGLQSQAGADIAGEGPGPGHGALSGGAKGMGGSSATSGGPFQSDSGQTLKETEPDSNIARGNQ